MKINRLLIALAVTALAVSACTPAPSSNMNGNANKATENTNVNSNINSNMEVNTNSDVNVNVNANINANMDAGGEVKEFTLTSFYTMEGSTPKPQFSVKEITVKKGDKVRIKVTNTKGNHDFNIDEYKIDQETPIDQEVVIEFTADKAGDFVYYCSKPGHRAAGHWGTLHVTQ